MFESVLIYQKKDGIGGEIGLQITAYKRIYLSKTCAKFVLIFF
ncbi:MAG: hypothetical protein ACI9RO_000218 [Alteromonas macleodii]